MIISIRQHRLKREFAEIHPDFERLIGAGERTSIGRILDDGQQVPGTVVAAALTRDADSIDENSWLPPFDGSAAARPGLSIAAPADGPGPAADVGSGFSSPRRVRPCVAPPRWSGLDRKRCRRWKRRRPPRNPFPGRGADTSDRRLRRTKDRGPCRKGRVGRLCGRIDFGRRGDVQDRRTCIENQNESLRVTRPAETAEQSMFPAQSFTFRSRKAFMMTDTELRLMAAPAMIGLRSTPKNG